MDFKVQSPRYFTFHFISVLIISFFGAFGSIRVSNAHPHLTTSSKVAVNGIDPILLGMTVEEAEVASGIKIVPNSLETSVPNLYCRIYKPQEKSLQGIEFVTDLKNNNRIVRMDFSNKNISTISGIKIGDTRKKVKTTYSEKILEILGRTGGKDLHYNPIDPTYKKYRLLFKFFEDSVISFRIAIEDWISDFVDLC